MNGKEQFAHDFVQRVTAAMDRRGFISRQQKFDFVLESKRVLATLAYEGPFQPGVVVELREDDRKGQWDEWEGCGGTVVCADGMGGFMVRYGNDTGTWSTPAEDMRLRRAALVRVGGSK
jgi:hypothetical protein